MCEEKLLVVFFLSAIGVLFLCVGPLGVKHKVRIGPWRFWRAVASSFAIGWILIFAASWFFHNEEIFIKHFMKSPPPISRLR